MVLEKDFDDGFTPLENVTNIGLLFFRALALCV